MKKSTKRMVALMLSFALALIILPSICYASEVSSSNDFRKVQNYKEGMFVDVKSNDWFNENISSVYETNLMIGKGDNNFDPTANMSVAEALTIAARLHSTIYTGKADFVQGNIWWEVYTNYCKKNKIADPSKYDLAKPITRGELAEIFSKALPKEGLVEINSIKDGVIPDVKSSDSFGSAVYMLYRLGILTGVDELGSFNPNSNVQRMEAAAITTRVAKPELRKEFTIGIPQNATLYTVTFDLGYDGEILKSVKVPSGDKVEKPSTPSRDKYKFTGWFDENGNKYDFDDEVTSSFTLTADWKKKSLGGGSSNPPAPTPVQLNTVEEVLETAEHQITSSNEWVGETAGNTVKISGSNLMLNHASPLTIAGISLASEVLFVSDDEYHAQTNVGYNEGLLHFNLTDGKLTSITVLGLTTASVLNDTYTFPIPLPSTVEEVLATAETPITTETQWTGNTEPSSIVKINGATLEFSNPDLHYNGAALSDTITPIAGTGNYQCATTLTEQTGIITFNMVNGVLTSIQVTGLVAGDCLNDIYSLGSPTPTKTIQDLWNTLANKPTEGSPWVGTKPGAILYKDVIGGLTYDNDSAENADGTMSMNELVTPSGDNYTCTSCAGGTITFNMSGETLVSITVSGLVDDEDWNYSVLNDTYAPAP